MKPDRALTEMDMLTPSTLMPRDADFFIQYKGTNICFDFWCGCGEEGHFDGYFAHVVECGNCGQTFELPFLFRVESSVVPEGNVTVVPSSG